MLSSRELHKREKLREKKPLVYEKIMRNPENPGPIIQYQVSYECNFRCDHCSVKELQSYKSDRLRIEDVANLSQQADDIGLSRFEINGGEPLVNNDLDEIIKAIKPDRFYMNLVTNAWLLTYEKIIHLKEIGVDRIQIGLDSLYQEDHDQFRRKKGAHKRCLDGVDACLNVGLDVFVTTVVTKQRLYSVEFIEFIEYFNKKDVGVFATFAKPVGAWQGQKDILLDEKDYVFFQELEKKHKLFCHMTPGYGRKGSCLAGNGLIAVTEKGEVMPCQYIFVTFGNFLKEPLNDIIERIKRIRHFKTHLCPIAMDRNFIEKYINRRVEGKQLPVPWFEVFTEEDLSNG